MKKWSIAFVTLTLIVTMATTSFAAKTIRVSLCNSKTHPQSIGLQLFKKMVEEGSNGKLTLSPT